MTDTKNTKEQLINKSKDLGRTNSELKNLSRNLPQVNQTELHDIKSNKRLRFLLANNPAVIYTCEYGGNWACTFMSGNVKEVFGYESTEFIENQNLWADGIHPEDRERVFSDLDNLTKNDFHSHEYRFCHKDGTYRWVFDELRVVRDKEGNPLECVGYWTDVSERKRSEQQAEEYTKRLKKLYELSMELTGNPDTIFQNILRMIGELIDVRVVCLSQILGDELYFVSVCIDGEVMNDVGHCPLSITPCATVKETKDIRVFDYVAERFPEASFLKTHNAFSYCGFPSLDSKGEVVAVTCLLDDKPHEFSQQDQELLQIFGQRIAFEIERQRDLDERKRTEEELQGSEQRYRAVVEDMPAMICRFLPDGTLTFVNKEYCNYFNKRSEELINQNFFQFIPECDQEKIRNHYSSLGKENPMVTYEHQAIAPDGRLRWQRWTDRALFNGSSGVTEYQSIGRDITDQKKLEEELLRSQKLESVGILAGGIAHDFNNLITAILSNIYLSKKYLDPGHKAFEYLEPAEKALSKAGALTQQLLTFSRGGTPVKRTMSLAGAIKDLVGFALSGSNVTCELDITDNLWLVDADEGQINQVMHNITTNADQSMPEGGIVSIHAENTILGEGSNMPLQEGRYLRITISDKGIGISEEHLHKVFDPYFTTKQKGNGLGLAVSYSIIKNHNGHISVESEVGVGTTFTIYLPASEKHIIEEKSSETRLIPGEGRILIMDDEEFMRYALGEMLMEIGYEVDFAGDGAEAIWKYEKSIKSSRPFDVVILDLTIPGGMGGKETIKKLLEVDPNVKAIVSSGYSDDAVMANFGKYGFSDVLSKPYDPEKLSHTLHKMLKGIPMNKFVEKII